MMANAGSKAYDAMMAALSGHLARFRAMDTPEFVECCVDMWKDAEEQIGTAGTIGDAMERMAACGSIEACAAMAAMGVEEKRVIAALTAVAERSPDIVEGCCIEALAIIVEKWADEEVTAGRMTVTIGASGQKLYATTETEKTVIEPPPIGGGTAALYATYLARLIEGARLPLGDEKLAQQRLAEHLDAIGISYVREYLLSDRNIVDFLIDTGVDRIAIELKIKGAARAVYRQCERYCAFNEVDALVLASRRALALPATIHGKPCVVASLAEGWL